MDRDVMLAKISSLERCIGRVMSKIPDRREDLAVDLDAQDIIVLNLERAVQLCVDIAAQIIAELKIPAPSTMAESFAGLARAKVITNVVAERMQKSVGFRNIAVHEYNAINWDVVYAIITGHLDDFRNYARQALAWLDSQEG